MHGGCVSQTVVGNVVRMVPGAPNVDELFSTSEEEVHPLLTRTFVQSYFRDAHYTMEVPG